MTQTLIDVLARHLTTRPDAVLYRYLPGGDPARAQVWTYAETYGRAAAVARLLAYEGLTGQRVLLLHAPGLDYIATFLGCLLARAVAVPAYPPDPARLAQTLPRIVAIARAAGVQAIATATALRDRARAALDEGLELPRVPWLCTDGLPPEFDPRWLAGPSTGDLAYLQFTSGSTSEPKGVRITHGNVIDNSRVIRDRFGNTASSTGVSWLPPYHDMGLIGGIVQPLFVGGSVTLMAPGDFLKRPMRWLEAISTFGATTSGGPDFAYELCAMRRLPPSTGLDLSRWRVAFTGAEPVRAQTLDRFAEVMAPFGFDRRAFYPCYGLAEATLFVTGSAPLEGAVEVAVDRAALGRGLAEPVDGPVASAVRVVSSGSPAPSHDVAIVSPEAVRLPERTVGEIWVAGGSVADGYWGAPEATAETFGARIAGEPAAGPYLRTGDLGFFAGGQLYVTGRCKDLIIVRGRNHYPQDLEQTLSEVHAAVRPRSCVAYPITSESAEGVGIAIEVRGREASVLRDVVAAVRAALATHHDLVPDEVALLAPRTLPKTSSGKPTRAATRDGIADGSIATILRWRRDEAATAATSASGQPPAPSASPASSASPLSPASSTSATSAVALAPSGSPGSVLSRAELATWLVREVSRRAGLAPGELDTTRPLVEYGLDSKGGVEIAGELEQLLGRPVQASLVWDHPSIDAIAAHLSGEVSVVTSVVTSAIAPATAGATDEPIAIVAMACRFPGGATSPEALWRLLSSGQHAVTEVPEQRWDHHRFYDPRPGVPGKMTTRWGGFLDGIDRFDAGFFGISPREADSLDPRQRLLLEVSWEALERAGLATEALDGSSTGVFVGLCGNDYYQRLTASGALDERYALTGNIASVAAGRLAYALGLAGPAIAVDTACSSSLVAVHLACQSLRSRECTVAVAAGANLVLAPEGTVYFSAMHAMSPTGRCAAFDDSADGYVRSDGCGVVVLRRLDDARRDGDEVIAIIRGSALNHDGRSNGLTAPNGQAQQAVIRQALARAGVAPAEVSYVEAHGTGTPLGDPIEAAALGAVFGGTRAASLRIGSVKTNLGHTEAAAGIAGLMKTALALAHEVLPATLHARTPSARVDWSRLSLDVVAAPTAWPRSDTPRIAGISSFGFSGTNAHVVLEEAPRAARTAELGDLSDRRIPRELAAPSEIRTRRALDISSEIRTNHESIASSEIRTNREVVASSEGRTKHESAASSETRTSPELVALSAPVPAALDAMAAQLAAHLRAQPDTRLSDIAYTLGARRRHFRHRAAFVASSTEQLRAALERRPAGAPRGDGRLAFVFSGQGSQRAGMGRELARHFEVFAREIERCDEVFVEASGLPRSLREVMWADPGTADAALLGRTEYTQPAIFALAHALFQLCRAVGVTPDRVAGHSVGEIAAACAAGVMSFDDAMRFTIARGLALGAQGRDVGSTVSVGAAGPVGAVGPVGPAGPVGRVGPVGTMLAVQASQAEVEQALAALGENRPVIAAVNGLEQLVVSGARDAVTAFAAAMTSRGVRTTELDVSHAFHSPLIEPALPALRHAAERLRLVPGAGLVSTVTGQLAGESVTRADYWVDQVRQPVQFATAVQTLAADGVDTYVELGATPVLLPHIVADERYPCLRRGHSEVATFLEAIGACYRRGSDVDWDQLVHGQRVLLPTYPWQRRSYGPTTGWPCAAEPPSVISPPDALALTHARTPGANGHGAASNGHAQTSNGHAQASHAHASPPSRHAQASHAHGSPPNGPAPMSHAHASPPNGHAPMPHAQASPPNGHAPMPHGHASPPNGHASPRVGSPALPASSVDRRTAILVALQAFIGHQLRLDPAEVRTDAPLIELGADSLVFLETGHLIERSYGVQIAPHQLFDELPSLEALAAYIAREQPAEVAAMPASIELPAPVSPAEVRTSAEALRDGDSPAESCHPLGEPVGASPPSYLASLVDRQLRIMEQQLQLLGAADVSGDAARTANTPSVTQPATLTETAPALTRPATVPAMTRTATAPAMTATAAPASATTAAPERPRMAAPASTTPTHHRRQELTRDQRAHLDGLIAAYTARTAGSRRHAEAHRAQLADRRSAVGFALDTKEMLYPIVGASSSGARLVDIDGNDYIDLAMGFGVHLFGHRPAFVHDALQHQLDRGMQIGPQSELAGEVAGRICALTGAERVTFCNSGTEAVMTALRLARATTGRARIVQFKGSYHGHFDGTLALGGADGTVAMAPGVVPGFVEDVLVLDYGDPAALDVIDRLGRDLAAVLVEPVQSRRPDVLPGAFLHELRRITERHGAALVFDEVITGFRVGAAGAQGLFGVRADLATYGKLLGGGLPIGVVAGAARFMDRVDGGAWQYGDASGPSSPTTFFAGTFSKNPLTMAASRAVLDHIARHADTLYPDLERLGARLSNALDGWFAERGIGLRVARCGSIARIGARLAPTGVTGQVSYLYEPLELTLLYHHLIARGVYVWEGRTIFLSSAHSDEDIDAVADAVKASIEALQAGGFFGSARAAIALGDARGTPAATSVDRASETSAAVSADRAGETSPADLGVASELRAPLSWGQEGLWFLSQLEGAASAYNLPCAVRLTGALDAEVLEAAITAIIARHAVLRTTFATEGDRVVQVIAPPGRFALARIDWTGVAAADQPAALRTLTEQQARTPFDLAVGPLVRATLVALAVDRWVLLATLHHIIADGWSLAIFVDELSKIYAAFAHGRPSPLPPLPLSYAAHAIADRARDLAPSLAYWRDQLAGAPISLDLPVDRGRPATHTDRSATYVAVLAADQVEALRALGRASGATLYMTLLGAFALLLHRLSGQDDLLIGSPVTDRARAELRGLIGFFVNTVVLRFRLAGELTAKALLRQVREVTLAAYAHQGAPFDQVVQAVQPPRLPGRHPFFQVWFNMDVDAEATALSLADVAVEVLDDAVDAPTQVDLSLVVQQRGGELICKWIYDDRLFDRERIEAMAHQLGHLARQLADAPEAPVHEASLVPPGHAARLPDPSAPIARPRVPSVVEEFQRWALQAPDHVAIAYGSATWSYAQLGERARAIACALRGRPGGVGAAAGAVAVSGPPSPGLVASVLGALMSGRIVVPIDPGLPAARRTLMMREAGATELVDVGAGAIDEDLDVLAVDPATGALPGGAASTRPLPDEPDEDAPAYVFYTSGTTGTPKGIVGTRAGIAHFVAWQRAAFAVGPGDRVSQLTRLSFDAILRDLFLPLTSGATLCIPDEAARTSPLAWMAEARVTIAHAVPSLAEHWLRLDDAATRLPHLRLAFLSGEPLSSDLVRRWRLVAPDCEVVNLYGPTETTMTKCFYRVPAEITDGPQPAGWPLPETQALVMSPDGGPRGRCCGIGEVGEIVVRTAFATLGYLGASDEQAARFERDPDGITRYRTGDRGRYRVDGSLEVLGRADRQVKLRGVRIELGEVEAALRRAGAAQAVALVTDGAALDRRLVAFVVPGGGALALDELRARLEAQVPEWMVPGAIACVDGIPLLPSGKTDAAALLARLAPPRTASAALPTTSLERLVLAEFEALLRAPVGIDDNFFELGGHSLLAAQLVTRLRRTTNLPLALRTLFENPTVAGIARHLDAIGAHAPPPAPALDTELIEL